LQNNQSHLLACDIRTVGIEGTLYDGQKRTIGLPGESMASGVRRPTHWLFRKMPYFRNESGIIEHLFPFSAFSRNKLSFASGRQCYSAQGQPNNDRWLTVTQCVFIKLLVFSPTRPRYQTKPAAGKGCRKFCLVDHYEIKRTFWRI
jgi:hypothetical protein